MPDNFTCQRESSGKQQTYEHLNICYCIRNTFFLIAVSSLGHVQAKGVNPSPKVRGTDSKLGRSGGMLPEIFLNFGTLKRHFQRFEGTYKVIVQCA